MTLMFESTESIVQFHSSKKDYKGININIANAITTPQLRMYISKLPGKPKKFIFNSKDL